MRYHFIDRIKRIEFGKEIVTLKNITFSEDYFEGHFVGFPVMPGALQVEVIAQACGALLSISFHYQVISMLLMVEKMKFRKLVHPGDQLITTARIISQNPESALLEVKIEVNGSVVTSGKVVHGIHKLASTRTDYDKVIQTLEDYFAFFLKGAEIIH
jgi:3-hydroxyacyl-[acyl-carrier-protein] dehydratase